MKKQIKSMVALLTLACIMLSIVGCTRSAKLVQVDGKWHYYDAKGIEQHGFVEYKENTYYITEDGTMNTGFWLNKEDEEYYYSDSDGIVQKNKFVDVDGKTYYLNDDGKRQYGWAEIDGKTMYFSNKDDGHMVKKGWIYDIPPEGGDKEYYYYFDDDGNMIRNEIKEINYRKYYFADDGKMKTGFVDFQGASYHFASDGVMDTGFWLNKDDEEYYYSDSDGVVQKNKFVDVDGKTYYLNADGKRQHGWMEIDGKTMYFHNKDNGGRMQKNGWIYDFPPHGGSKEKYFFADEDGNIVRNKILDVDEIWQTDKIERRKHLLTFGKVRKYFLNPDGEMQTGFVDFQGARYYFADDGQMRIGSFKVDGATYNTDENGRIIN